MPIQQIFINNLKSYRKKAGFTQAQLAILIDKSFNYINGIECGVSFPPPNVIDKISEVLKIKPMQLFAEEGCKENIINSDKEKFIKELSEQILRKIEPAIKKHIIEGLRTNLE